MLAIKQILRRIRENSTEIYLGILLFLALPAVIAWYFDIRAGVLASILIQTAVLMTYILRAR